MGRIWGRYWFAEESSVGLAVFRVTFGLVLLFYHVPRLFYVRGLYTTDGYLVPMDLFRWLHLPIPTFAAAVILNIVLHLAIISFVIGYRTRFSIAVVLALHTYFSLLEYFSTFGVGTIMIIYLLLFLVSPAGAFLSLDFSRRRNRELVLDSSKITQGIQPPSVPVTMQHIMLWQLALIYIFNVLAKLKYGGGGWFDGSELWNIFANTGQGSYSFMLPVANYIAPLLPNIGIVSVIGLTIVGTGLLIPFLRPYAIAFGVVYHSVAMFTVLAPISFSLLMMSLYLVAPEPQSWQAWWERLVQKFSRSRFTLQYDGECPFCRRSAAWVKALDFFNKVEVASFPPWQTPEEILLTGPSGKPGSESSSLLPGKTFRGFFAFRRLAWYIPHGWLLLPILGLPGAGRIGKLLYQWVAANRYALCRACAI